MEINVTVPSGTIPKAGEKSETFVWSYIDCGERVYTPYKPIFHREGLKVFVLVNDLTLIDSSI